MLKTYQYRVYPSTKQRLTLESWLDACQTLYNQGLAMRIKTFKQTGKSVSYNSQAKMLTDLRRHSSFWKGIHVDVLQDTLRRLDKAYDAFYRRLKAGDNPGFPRFKGRGRYRSITFSHLSVNLIRTIRRKFARVVVPKIGHVKIRYHRPLPEGSIKTLTIQSPKTDGRMNERKKQVVGMPISRLKCLMSLKSKFTQPLGLMSGLNPCLPLLKAIRLKIRATYAMLKTH